MAARYSLQGKTVFVTGTARGIGAEVARQAAGRGARVACVGLEPEELRVVAQACGDRSFALEADVTDLDALRRAVDATVEETGGIDVVVANAGIGVGGPVHRVAPEAFERVIQVNLIGVYKTIHACLPHVIDRRGYVLPIASLSAIFPYFPGFASYAASKAGVEALGTSLRSEVQHLGVDVGVCYLSWIATDLVLGADAEHPAFRFLRSKLRGPVGKTHELPDAGLAIVRGIERRATSVVFPRWIHAAIALRGLLGPVTAKQSTSEAPEALALYEAEYQREGEEAASRPVGAGGAADARSAGLAQ